MRSLKQCFAGIPIGGPCIGTIHFFGLQASRLLKSGIIKLNESKYVFNGFDNRREHESSEQNA